VPSAFCTSRPSRKISGASTSEAGFTPGALASNAIDVSLVSVSTGTPIVHVAVLFAGTMTLTGKPPAALVVQVALPLPTHEALAASGCRFRFGSTPFGV